MFDFDAMATFVQVVQLGSFSAAAEALRRPRSTVSQRVARLEATLGVRLIERTTRVVRPTSAGTAYHKRCAHILAEMEAANAAVKDLDSSPHGVLRVAAPLVFGEVFLAGMAAAFTQRYPGVEIEIIASDRTVSPIEEGFDVAIMVFAPDDDSSLVARRLKGSDLWLCATPAYFKARGRPESPADLDDHACIVWGESRVTRWAFERGSEVVHVGVRGALSMNSFAMVHEAVRTGAGIAPIPTIVCAEDVREGRLARVLADWSIDRKALRVVYPSGRHLSPRIRLFVDTLVAEFRARFAATAEPPAGDRRSAHARPPRPALPPPAACTGKSAAPTDRRKKLSQRP